MYVPSHFRQDNADELYEAMERIGFVSMVTNAGDGLMATHAPVLMDRADGPKGTIRGHIAKANSQWKTSRPEQEALAIFTGPNAYVSPQWYASKREHGRVVPTWNYIAVHAYGSVRFSEDHALLRDIVTRLTARFEAGSPEPWKVSDAPAEYVDGMLNAIVAFEMPISRIEASWKLSQNKSDADRAGVVSGLSERGDWVAEEMKEAFRKGR